jgi:phosphonate transport system substrate-binding protein
MLMSRKRMTSGLLFALAFIGYVATALATGPLQIGILPYLPVRSLIVEHQPLRDFLQQGLGREVELYSAPDFKTFYANTREGKYDIVITAAHFARVAQLDQGYVPMVRYSGGARGLLVVARNSPILRFEQLRGKAITGPDRLALVSLVVVRWLHDHGMEEDRDYTLMTSVSFNTAILTVQRGEAAAAMSAPAAMRQMPAKLRDSVRIVADTGDYTNLIYLANPRLNKDDIARIKELILQFAHDTQSGRTFLNATGFGSIIPVTAADMGRLDVYVPETRRLLASGS